VGLIKNRNTADTIEVGSTAAVAEEARRTAKQMERKAAAAPHRTAEQTKQSNSRGSAPHR